MNSNSFFYIKFNIILCQLAKFTSSENYFIASGFIFKFLTVNLKKFC